jgi:hypothetical protein
MAAQISTELTVANLSVCDSQNAEKFLGQRVTIDGQMAFTPHGIFLLADSCGKSNAQDVVILFPKADNAPMVDFDLDVRASDSLYKEIPRLDCQINRLIEVVSWFECL